MMGSGSGHWTMDENGRYSWKGYTPPVVRPNPWTEICGTRVRVSRYGGGVRWYCPTCDVRRDGAVSFVSWTNGPPPDFRQCPNPVE